MSEFTDTERLDWLAANKASLTFSDYVAQVSTRDKGRATTYHHVPTEGHAEVEPIGVSARRSIDSMMRKDSALSAEKQS